MFKPTMEARKFVHIQAESLAVSDNENMQIPNILKLKTVCYMTSTYLSQSFIPMHL